MHMLAFAKDQLLLFLIKIITSVWKNKTG